MTDLTQIKVHDTVRVETTEGAVVSGKVTYAWSGGLDIGDVTLQHGQIARVVSHVARPLPIDFGTIVEFVDPDGWETIAILRDPGDSLPWDVISSVISDWQPDSYIGSDWKVIRPGVPADD